MSTITNISTQLRRTWQGRWVLRGLLLLAAIVLLADLLAQDKPLIARYEGHTYFPVAMDYFVLWGWQTWPEGMARLDWHTASTDWAVWPLIPYSPNYQDIDNPSVGPFDQQAVAGIHRRHWLGTDELGRDLLAAMLHATRIDLLVALVAMAIAGFLGLLLGGMAGFWGDDRAQLTRARLAGLLLAIWPAVFYGITLGSLLATSIALQILLGIVISSVIVYLFQVLARPLHRFSWWCQSIALPLDLSISRLIEITVSIPVLFLILLLLSMTERGSLLLVMVVIGATRWTGIARLVRAELLRIRALDYMTAAESMGYKRYYMLWKHALPNAMGPIYIALAFGIAQAILTAGFLSFIGLGLPPDVPTWGSLLNMGRENLYDWWLALFPGLALFGTVLLFNLFGTTLGEK